MPITSYASVERMATLIGSAIPPGLQSALEHRKDDPEAVAEFGTAYATLQCAELLAHGAPGIHFYTMNRSPATRAILSALKLLRPWERGGALTAGAVG
jgi:methylenetetrahydrofolate reductase (NADPH)